MICTQMSRNGQNIIEIIKAWGKNEILNTSLLYWKKRGKLFLVYYFILLLLSHFSHVRLCVAPWTAAHQAPLSLGFSRQEQWSGDRDKQESANISKWPLGVGVAK